MRAQIGGQDKTIFASFGLFNSQKRLAVALRAFQRLQKAHPGIVYILVGTALDPELQSRLSEDGLLDQVITTGWLSPDEFTRYMYAIDIAVQLRYPHVGGTPYTPIRLLGLGVPTIISAIEPQADIPQNAVIRIQPNRTDEESRLYAAMENLLLHPEQRQALAAASVDYILAHHQPGSAAESLAGFLRQVNQQKEHLSLQASRRVKLVPDPLHSTSNMVAQAGRALTEMGVNASDDIALAAIADAIYDLSQPLT
ncbi:MAG: glycosyltransferase [Anaerolineae bacterium]